MTILFYFYTRTSIILFLQCFNEYAFTKLHLPISNLKIKVETCVEQAIFNLCYRLYFSGKLAICFIMADEFKFGIHKTYTVCVRVRDGKLILVEFRIPTSVIFVYIVQYSVSHNFN